MSSCAHAILALTAILLVGCDESVRLSYSTRAEAEADSPFARGWLPEIIPASSREITMVNDLDLNLSEGEFAFDSADHDKFVSHLVRMPGHDDAQSKFYEYGEWGFWIDDSQDRCRFRIMMAR